MDTNTPVCKGHDFESCDDDNYSSEEHELSDDEGNVITRKDGIVKRDAEDNDDDDYYWTDTTSEGEDDQIGIDNDQYTKNDDRNVKNDDQNEKTGDQNYNDGNRNDKDGDRNDKDNTSGQENDKFDDENRVLDGDKENGNTEDTDITAYNRHRPSGGHRHHHRGSSHGHGHSGRHGHHTGRRGGHSHHNGGGHQHHHSSRMSKVFMPTGRVVSIAVPNELKGWKCGRPTKLLTLRPHGEHSGREYRLVEKVVNLTKRHHSQAPFDHYHFVKIQKIVNGCFWKRYLKRQQEIYAEANFVNERMLFHGTGKVKELMENGFDERYANINGMYGAGIYFAKHSSKSNQYAFGGVNGPCPAHRDRNCDRCERHILLCRVTMGKVMKVKGAAQTAHAPPGHHSVEGLVTPGVLRYPEYIVYRGEQVYAEYLVTYKIVK